MKVIGIECESIEGKNPMWGVGRLIMKLLEEISHRPELEKDFRFVLYFKDSIPNFQFLDAPIFEKKITPVPLFINRLFPIYYFALLPMKLWFEGLDWMFWPNYMLPIIAFNKSVVMLTEDVYYETHTGRLPFRYRLAYGIFGWWTAKWATKILTISETSKKNIAKLYNIKPDRIFVNYPGVDFDSASASSYAKTLEDKQATMRYQRKEGNYILFVGQMFPRRHVKETILAFEKLISEFYNLKLIMIGPDKYKEPVINLLVSKINGRLNYETIIHKDYVKDDELVELYADAKVLVYISDREAFGLPPMEALSFGVPPVIADNELGHELFGEYASYVKNPDTDGIADGIRQALTQSDKIEKIKSFGRQFVKKYNWKNFTDRFLNEISK